MLKSALSILVTASAAGLERRVTSRRGFPGMDRRVRAFEEVQELYSTAGNP